MAKKAKKLSDSRVVNALRPEPDKKNVIHFDNRIPGFGVRVNRSGAMSWVLKYRTKHGEPRKFTLGPAGKNGLEPSVAREMAIDLKARIAKGGDPAAEKKAAYASITVSELCDQYLEAAEGRIKESTLDVDRSRIDRHVKPLLGPRKVASLKTADLEKFLSDVIAGKSAPKATETAPGANAPSQDGQTDPKKEKQRKKRKPGGVTRGGPGVAARTLGMLGTILQRSVRDGVIASNPARGIARPKDKAKKPPFSFETISAVGEAMRAREPAGENVAGLRAIRFLMLTGLRRMEALTLTWGMVDRRARCIRFADTKSGAQTRPLGRAALEWLASFEPKGARASVYVFPGAEADKHLVGLPKIWERVAKQADLPRVSLHGLRHWYASAAAEMNYSELTIAGLLGHRVKGVTARYATAPDSALLAAADRVSLRIAAVLDGRDADTNLVSLVA